jgi:uncharacterized protein (DUF433 family)
MIRRRGTSGLCQPPSACDDGFAGKSMHKEYVRTVDGAYRIGDTRISLDSLVYLFREGLSAESMVESYPILTLEQVHGARAFYLGNQHEIDAYLAEGQRTSESQQQQSKRTNAELIAKLERARVRVRFQADADLDGRILRGLRRIPGQYPVSVGHVGRTCSSTIAQ